MDVGGKWELTGWIRVLADGLRCKGCLALGAKGGKYSVKGGGVKDS